MEVQLASDGKWYRVNSKFTASPNGYETICYNINDGSLNGRNIVQAEVSNSREDWDFEKMKEKFLEIVKFFWSQPIVRRFIWLGILALAGFIIAVEFVTYILGTVFYELVRLLFRLVGVHI